MKRLCLIVAVGTFTFICSHQWAMGVEWVQVTKVELIRDITAPIFIDKSSISTEGKFTRVLAKAEYDKPDTVGKISERVLWEFDCHGKKYRSLKLIIYYENGDSNTIDEASAWGHIIPTTIGEAIYEAVCP